MQAAIANPNCSRLLLQHIKTTLPTSSSSFYHDGLHTQILADISNQCINDQIQHRSWLTVQLSHFQLDLELASRNIPLSTKPAILVNSEFRIAQRTRSAQNLKLHLNEIAPIFSQTYSELVMVPTTSASSNHASLNLLSAISTYLQQFDKDVESDYSLGLFSLDLTNYLSESTKNISTLLFSIENHITSHFKVTATTRIAPNLLLSRLAHTQENLSHITTFSKHRSINLSVVSAAGLLSNLLQQHLHLLNIFTINDIFENRTTILNTFGEELTTSLLRLYYGIGRVYHSSTTVDIGTLKAGRQLSLSSVSNQDSISQKIKEITQQLATELQHLNRIAKSAKLTLTRADHSQLSSTRDFMNKQHDYFDYFHSDCQAILKSLRISDSLFRSVQIQLFEIIPKPESSSFATRFQAAIKSMTNGVTEIKKASLVQQPAAQSVTNEPKIVFKQNIVAAKPHPPPPPTPPQIEELKTIQQIIPQKQTHPFEEMKQDHVDGNDSIEEDQVEKPVALEVFQNQFPKRITRKDSDENSCSSQSSSNDNLLKQKKQHIFEKFTCPVCGNQIDCKSNFSLINSHVDQCLAKQSANSQARDSKPINSNVPVPTNANARRFQGMSSSSNSNGIQINSGKASKRGRPVGSKITKTTSAILSQSSNLLGYGFKK